MLQVERKLRMPSLGSCARKSLYVENTCTHMFVPRSILGRDAYFSYSHPYTHRVETPSSLLPHTHTLACTPFRDPIAVKGVAFCSLSETQMGLLPLSTVHQHLRASLQKDPQLWGSGLQRENLPRFQKTRPSV